MSATYQFTLYWTNTDSNVDANLIERSLDGVTFTPLATVAPDPASYQDNGLVTGYAYYYRVRSHSPAGDSEYSNVAVGTTPPLLVITSPTDYQTVTSAVVKGTARGANGLQSVTVNGQAAVINGANWSATVTLTVGTNALTVVATDNSADHNDVTQIVHAILLPPPVADFTGNPTAGAAPLHVKFTNTSTGTITSRIWTFGDGATSTKANPSHTYAAAGTYAVKLIVSGPGGSAQLNRASYITVTNVVVDLTAPTLTIASPGNYQLFANAGVTVSGTASDASGIQQVIVNGQPASLSGNSWSLGVTLAEGTNTLTVVATDNSSNHNVMTQTIRAVLKASSSTNNSTQLRILDGPLVTNAMAQVGDVAVIVAGQPVRFSVTATDALKSTLEYSWDFGDQQNGYWSAPVHTYPDTNCQSYAVHVVVNNGMDSITGTVQVATACQLEVTKLQMHSNFVKPNADRFTLYATVDQGVAFNPNGQTLAVDLGQAQVSFQLDQAGRGSSAYGKCRLTYDKLTGLWNLKASLKNGNWHDLWVAYNLLKGPLSVSAISVSVPAIVVVGHDAFAAEPQMQYSAATEKSGNAH